MRVNFINTVVPNYNKKQKVETPSTVSASPVTNPLQKPVGIQYLAARGINFTSRTPEEKILDDYNWFVNHDRTQPVDAFLKTEEKPEVMDNLLKHILKDENLSDNFIESLTKVPRRIDEYGQKIQEKIGNFSTMIPFIPNSPYNVAYQRFMDNKVENAKSIEALVKLRPDWKQDVLIQKYKSLRGSDDFQIGNIPKEFPGDSFGDIVKYLKTYRQTGYKSKVAIPTLESNGHKYNFEFFTEGKSDKNVFGVYTQGKKFIFKMGDEKDKSLNEPFALGTLALIDNYLTLHRCRNSAPVYYYNHNCNTSIYKYIEHNTVDEKLGSSQAVNTKLPDFKNLGMSYNDTIGVNNYFVLKDHDDELYDIGYGINHNELISVDNDHVTYYNRLMPLVDKYNKPLPNAMQTAF